MKNLLWVMLGGGIGAGLRYGFSMAAVRLAVQTHWATLVVNVLASALLALVIQWAPQKSGPLYLFLAVGLCGGWSTFSTFSVETMTLIQNGEWPMALLYVLSSTVLCFLAVYAVFSAAGA